jgi:hypothetical protein
MKNNDNYFEEAMKRYPIGIKVYDANSDNSTIMKSIGSVVGYIQGDIYDDYKIIINKSNDNENPEYVNKRASDITTENEIYSKEFEKHYYSIFNYAKDIMPDKEVKDLSKDELINLIFDIAYFVATHN